MTKLSKTHYIERLLEIMNELREKCPWDKKQTIDSLRHLTIEEVYELSESIAEKDTSAIKSELGDVLLHVVFYSKIFDEKNKFNFEDVVNVICEKLIERHPHIYGDVKLENEQEVKKNWEKLKIRKSKKGLLSGVPKSLPAMVKARRVQDKTSSVGFFWNKIDNVYEKLYEEIDELKQAVDLNNKKMIENELGDVLFTVINISKMLDIDAEMALEKTNKKFIKRFEYIENKVNFLDNKIPLEQLDKYWEESKIKNE